MTRLVSNPMKKDRKVLSKDRPYKVDKIQASIERGDILRYSLFVKDVKENIDSLKNSNPKYLSLILKIIQISITQLQGTDIIVPLNVLLPQLNQASYYNHEALDFTTEVLEFVDILTAKYFLAHLSAGILQRDELKKQFKATIQFVKNIVASLPQSSEDLYRQKEFMKAVKILINSKADPKRIEILPKLKYLADTNLNADYELNIIDIVYGNTSIEDLINQVSQKANYLTQNSL